MEESLKSALTIIDTLLLVIVGLWNCAAHWTPWNILPFLLDDDGELHRVVAYAHGTFTILAVCGVWSLARWCVGVPLVAAWSGALFLGLAIVSAGIGTLLPRGLEWIEESQAQRKDNTDYEQAIQG